MSMILSEEQQRNEQLDDIVRRMYRDCKVELNNAQAAYDWVNMTKAEIAREKKNARVGARTIGLRSRLRHLITLILAH